MRPSASAPTTRTPSWPRRWISRAWARCPYHRRRPGPCPMTPRPGPRRAEQHFSAELADEPAQLAPGTWQVKVSRHSPHRPQRSVPACPASSPQHRPSCRARTPGFTRWIAAQSAMQTPRLVPGQMPIDATPCSLSASATNIISRNPISRISAAMCAGAEGSGCCQSGTSFISLRPRLS